jgi:hypothetical protein
MKLFAVALTVIAFAGCATATGTTGPDVSASPRTHEPLAGHWRGALWETAPWFFDGHRRVEVDIDPDRYWRGTIDSQPASGVVRNIDDDVVLLGAARRRDGSLERIYHRLVADGDHLWGQTMTTFGGRRARASASLQR